AFLVPGHLGLLPRRELAIGLAQQLLGLGLQARDLLRDVHVAGIGQMAQLGDLAFQFGDGFLEIEEAGHGLGLVPGNQCAPEICWAFATSTSAWRIEARSISRPSSATAPRPSFCAWAIAS